MARAASRLLSVFRLAASRGGSPTRYSSDEKRKSGEDEQMGSGITTYRSFPRSRTFSPLSIGSLIGLGLLLLLVLGLLVFLYQYVAARDGLSPFSQNHYILAYIPTTMMVVIVAFWRQVDHQCKILTPWDELHQHKAKASKSILLDYVSDFQATSLIRAVRSRHLAVTLSISGFIILKIVTISSTGLMVLHPSAITETILVPRRSAFDGQLYANFSFVNNMNNAAPIYTAYGVFAKGLLPPFGTQTDLAFETYANPSGRLANSSLYVNARAVVPHVQCRSAQVELQVESPDSDSQLLQTTNRLISPCNIDLSHQIDTQVSNPRKLQVPPRQLIGGWTDFWGRFPANCSVGDLEPSKDSPGWYLLTLADIRYNQTVNTTSSDFEALSGSLEVDKVSSLLCQVSYTVQAVNVSDKAGSNGTELSVISSPNLALPQLDRFNGSGLASLMRFAFEGAGHMFRESKDDETMLEEVPNVLLTSMASANGVTYEALVNNITLMARTAEIVLQNVAVHVVDAYLRKPDDTAMMPAMIVFKDKLLHISPASLWTMVAGFAMTSALIIALSVVKPRMVWHGFVNDIGKLGMLLSYSKGMQRILNADQFDQGPPSRDTFEKYQYSLFFDRERERLTIDVDECSSIAPVRPHEEGKPKDSSWMPFTLRRPVLYLTLILPICFIAVLECLQRLSDGSQGIATVQSSSHYVEDVYSRYLPALTMLLMATLFNCLDFNVLLMTPFSAFQKTALPATTFKSNVLLGISPPSALLRSIKHGYLAAISSSLAAFIGALLTIVVSGLYSINEYASSSHLELRNLDQFTSNWHGSVTNDNGAAIVSSLTEFLGLEYPKFTFDQLAFSQLDIVSQSINSGTNISEQLVEVSLPAYRASLECVSMATSNFTVNVEKNPVLKEIVFDGNFSLPSTCQRGGKNGTDSTVNLNYLFSIDVNTNGSTYIGKLFNLQMGPLAEFQDSAIQSRDDDSSMPDNPAGLGCPSLAFIYGNVPLVSDSDAKATVAAEICYQRLQQVQVNLTLKSSDLSIATLFPPTTDENTAIYKRVDDSLTKNKSDPMTTMGYRIQANIAYRLATFNAVNNSRSTNPDFNSTNKSTYNPLISSSGGSESSPPVDTFFQTVFFGRKPIPLSHLNLTTEQDREAVMEGIQALYGRYMAQAMSANMRVPVDDKDNEIKTFSAVMPTGTTVRRFVQNKTPKIVLQAILAFMFVCGCVVIFTGPLRDLLPMNPCTIAGIMLLWSGSECVKPATTEEQRILKGVFRDAVSRAGVVYERREEVKFQLGHWETYAEGGSAESLGRTRYGFDMIYGHGI